MSDDEPLSASHTVRNFRQADERIATCGQPSEAQLAAAAATGIEVVINLALHDDPRYSLSNEAATVKSSGMDYVHIPVQFDAPTADDLRRFCDAMDATAGRKVLVHCAANMRVTAFLALYRVLRQGWSKEEAFLLMESVWSPNATWAKFIDDQLNEAAPSA